MLDKKVAKLTHLRDAPPSVGLVGWFLQAIGAGRYPCPAPEKRWTTMLDEATVAEFGEALRGDLIQPGDEGYDEARKVYNAMIDKRPRTIARCSDVADVVSCVDFARENGVLLAVRGGGHNGAGTTGRAWAWPRTVW